MVIDTSTVNLLKRKLKTNSKDLDELHDSAKSIYQSVDDIIKISNPSVSKIKSQFSKAKTVLTHTNNWTDNFNSISDPYKEIEEKLANQKVVIGKLTSALSGGYAHIGKGSFVFNTKYLQDTENFDKKVKKQLIKKTPALDIIDGKNIKASELNDLVNLIGEVKNNGNKIFKAGKTFKKRFTDLFVIAALTKDEKGRIGFRTVEDMVKAYEMKTKKNVPKGIIKLLEHMDQKYIVDQLTKNLSKSSVSKRGLRVLVNIRGEFVKNGETLAKKHLHVIDSRQLYKPKSTRLKSYKKSALKAAKDEVDFKGMWKDFKDAKGLKKILPGLNIGAKVLTVCGSVSSSNKLADESKLKGNWKGASVAGGVAIDLGTAAADLITSGLVTLAGTGLAAAGVTVSAPVWVTAGAVAATGIGVAYITSKISDKLDLGTKVKKTWNNVLSWGMKHFK